MPHNPLNMPGYGDHVTWGPINWNVGHDPRLPDYNERRNNRTRQRSGLIDGLETRTQ